ncbi:MAG: GAF domain-containing protein [Anaerolineae bacterium]|nr:GAF domain-containing protein [Anaerolineae bacterium]
MPDVSQDERYARLVEERLGFPIRSLAAVPLIAQDRMVGVLEVMTARGRQTAPFVDEDVELLESLAGEAAVAIVNARLFEQTQRRVLELSTLLDASSAASSTLDIGSVLELIAGRLLKALRAERCIVYSWLRESNELSSLAEVTDATWPRERAPTLSLDESPLARMVLEKGLPVVANIGDDAASAYQAMMTRTGIQSMLAVPLLIESEARGYGRALRHDARPRVFRRGSASGRPHRAGVARGAGRR